LDLTPDAAPEREARAKRDAEAQPFPPADNVMLLNTISTTGFALPANELKRVTTVLMTGVKPAWHPGWLGVQIGMPRAGSPQGARIEGVYVNGSADRAGLQPGDIVAAVDGRPIEGDALKDISRRLPAGQTLRLEVRRGDKTLLLPLTAQPRPADEEIKHTPLRTLGAKAGYAPAVPAARTDIA
jgi:S1-C subfamily serine protease